MRGALVNVAIFLPYIVLAALATELGFEWMHALLPGSEIRELWRDLPLVFIALFVAAVLVYPLVATALRHRLSWSGRNRYDRALSTLGLLVIFSWVLAIMAHGVMLAIESSPGQAMSATKRMIEGLENWRSAALWGVPTVLTVLLATLTLGSGRVARLLRSGGIHLLGLLSPALLLLIFYGLITYWVSSPFLPLSLAAALDRREISPALLAAMDDKALQITSPQAYVTVVTPGAEWVVHDGAYRYRIRRHPTTLQINWRDMWVGEWDGYILAFALLLFALNRMALSINTSSGNGFYRDRISRAYLIQPEKDGTVRWVDDLRLSQLNGPGTAAPYHLVNAALNLQGSDDPDLRGREADFFLFSPRWSGSRRTGYCATSALERADPNFDLATAIAISGAAVAPNMGDATNRALVFDLTMLNFRLAYWLPNPAAVRRALHWPRWGWHWTVPGASYLSARGVRADDGHQPLRQRLGRRPHREPRHLQPARAPLPRHRRRRRRGRSAHGVPEPDPAHPLRPDRPRGADRHRYRGDPRPEGGRLSRRPLDDRPHHVQRRRDRGAVLPQAVAHGRRAAGRAGLRASGRPSRTSRRRSSSSARPSSRPTARSASTSAGGRSSRPAGATSQAALAAALATIGTGDVVGSGSSGDARGGRRSAPRGRAPFARAVVAACLAGGAVSAVACAAPTAPTAPPVAQRDASPANAAARPAGALVEQITTLYHLNQAAALPARLAESPAGCGRQPFIASLGRYGFLADPADQATCPWA
ncbi:MAG: hypothetical protein U0470_14175 [Anaerolineae bacterium]